MKTDLYGAATPAAVVLVRIAIGCVFRSEGIRKFLFPDALGVGRFAKIGIPWPWVSAPFDGVVETVCGALLLVGAGRVSPDARLQKQ